MQRVNGRKLVFFDFFAGAGGFTKGFVDAGYQPGVLLDCDTKAIETLEVNFGDLGAWILHHNIEKITPKRLEWYLISNGYRVTPDVMVGGPPCQGWSVIGRGKLRSLGVRLEDIFDDPRNRLYQRYIKFVVHYQPKVFIMENVPGMLNYNGINVAEKVADFFNRKGYFISWEMLNSMDFGVPQNRKRLFFVGVRKDLGIEFQMSKLKRKKKIVSLKDAIFDLPVIRDGAKEWIRPYRKPPNPNSFVKQMRIGTDPRYIYDHVCSIHREQDLEAFKELKQGGYYDTLPARLKRYRDDIFGDKYRKLRADDVSGTITAHLSKDQYSHIHPTQTRTITVREAARIQSFPDSYYFAGGMGDKFKQIGNAVSPLVARAFADEIKNQVFSKTLSKKRREMTRRAR